MYESLCILEKVSLARAWRWHWKWEVPLLAHTATAVACQASMFG
jgi:hypothetical protein